MNKRDLSSKTNNPTSALQRSYHLLMNIQDPDELQRSAIEIIKPLVGNGISERNYRIFLRNLQNSSNRGLEGIQMFISNYILKGSGLGVESREIAIASFITEDANKFTQLTIQQQNLKEMVESYGFHVAIL